VGVRLVKPGHYDLAAGAALPSRAEADRGVAVVARAGVLAWALAAAGVAAVALAAGAAAGGAGAGAGVVAGLGVVAWS
jgi:adenosylcobinamide-phosphate synthase